VITRLTLIAAAPTAANRAFAFPADEPAEPKALAALSDLAARLPHPDRVLAGPARSARQTAEALGLDAEHDPLLRDCDYGRWTGRTLAELETEDPAAVAEWLTDPAAAPHGGESLDALVGRAAEFLTAQSATPGQVLAVTHPAFIRAAIVHVLAAPALSFWRIDVAPLSVTRLSGVQGRWNLTASDVR
jgi:broad specificity phosphatase PhoE